MMNEFIVKVEKSTRMVDLPKNVIGNDMENLQEKLIFKFTDEFINGQARLEYKIGSTKNYIVLSKENNTYTIPLKNVLTKEGKIEMQLVITENEVDEEIPVFKSNVFYLYCNKSINAVNEAPDGYQLWIETANAKLNLMDEALTEVDNLNIDVNKIDTTTTVEITKKDGTTKTVNILDGERGENGTDGTDGLTPTIGQNGNWYLGDTDTGKPSRGEKGDKGDTGNDGINGQDGYTPQKGIDYFTSEDIESLNIPDKTSQLQNDSGFLTNLTNNLVNYTLKTNTGSLIDLEINQTTYVVTLKLKDVDGNIISTDTIDLPLENVVVSGRYDNNTKKVILTLENGSEVDFSVADLVAGLQTEITSQNKLASDLVDDTNSGNKFVTSSEKQTWNNKLDSSDLTNYITNTDYVESGKAGIIKLSSGLGASNGYIYLTVYSYENYNNATNGLFIGKGTLENVITGKNLETGDNKVTTISSSSTNTEYPSAKAVYDYIQSLDGDEVSY